MIIIKKCIYLFLRNYQIYNKCENTFIIRSKYIRIIFNIYNIYKYDADIQLIKYLVIDHIFL